MTSVSDLPPELLSLIGRRLHTAVDVVRFHAVCTEWRQSMRYLPPTPPDQPLPVAAAFLPWLLAPSSTSESDDAAAGVACRCVFSKTSYHAPGVCFRDRRVAHADGTGSWLIDGVLVNPLSGWIDIDPVKQYPWKWIDGKGFCHCVVSGDGSFFVYRLSPRWGLQGRLSITGYTWIPGKRERSWVSGLPGAAGCGVVYHRGATVSVDLANCYIHKKDLLWLRNTSMPLPDEPGKVRQRSYLLELGGKLLLASVLKDAGCTGDDDDRLSVSVHAFDVDAALYALDPDAALEEAEPAAAAPASPVWEKRDNVLGDHILFLGYPGSFAAEAARFDGDVPGGSAYFVVRSEPCRVYRYSFVDGGGGTAAATTTSTSTLVETLPAGWNDERCMWFLPLPGIVDPALTEEEEEEEDAARANQQRQQRDLRIYVRDLSPKVDSCRLREMYSKHGKVVQARVAYDKRGRSRGFGFVTMATQEGFDRALGRCNAVAKPDYPVSTTEIIFGWCLLVLFLFLAYYIIASFCRLISRWM